MAGGKKPKDDPVVDLTEDTAISDAPEKLVDERLEELEAASSEEILSDEGEVDAPAEEPGMDASEPSEESLSEESEGDTDKLNEALDADGSESDEPDEGVDEGVIAEDRVDPESNAIDETAEETREPSAPPPVQQRSSVWPAVFGGVIAAMLGFIAGRGDQLDAFLPASMHRQSADLTPLVAQDEALKQANDALAGRIESLESVPPNEDLPQALSQLDAAVSEINDLKATIEDLTGRLAQIEARPPETVETIIQQPADNTEQIESLQASIEALQDRISEDEARAKSEAELLLAQAALTRVMTAVESGETFEPALGALEEVAPVEVPQALRTAAAEGVPSMSMLRENFPDAARAGLAAARAEVPESEVAGIGGFLRRQLSARSVTPREGTDPDAVLSRAEAEINAGNLDAALGELEGLPDVAKTAMQGWLDGAFARQNARKAAEELSDSLTVN